MRLDRRALLGAMGAGVAMAGASAQAQTQGAAPPAEPTLEARLTARAQEHRSRLLFDGVRFSGPAYEALLEEGRAARFFCLGEEHGVAENPKLAAQLFAALAGVGYSKACIEISPPMARELDRAAQGGMDGVRALFTDPRANVAFFTMREEAEWIVAARAAVRGRGQALWGLDYEVGGFGRLIDILEARRKPAAAQAAFAAMRANADTLDAAFARSRSPEHIYSFAGDPALVAAVRAAWPNADSDAVWMLETLEQTLTINGYWQTQQGWLSNQSRALLNRANFRRYWERERTKPRVFFKFGASHMVRGLTHTQVFDVGSQVSELAEAQGGRSFHVMVLPGVGAQHAQLDVRTWRYAPVAAGAYNEIGMAPLLGAAYDDAMTLIDLRPLRPLVFGRRHKALDADLVRAVHGFDALLVMTGSTASANL